MLSAVTKLTIYIVGKLLHLFRDIQYSVITQSCVFWSFIIVGLSSCTKLPISLWVNYLSVPWVRYCLFSVLGQGIRTLEPLFVLSARSVFWTGCSLFTNYEKNHLCYFRHTCRSTYYLYDMLFSEWWCVLYDLFAWVIFLLECFT